MSCDEQVRHISQKYAMAVAIAVINTKPADKTLEQHIEDIKTNINNEEMIMEDLDITICSDDFNFNDNNENDIINEANDENNDDRGFNDCEVQDSITVYKIIDDCVENNDENNDTLNNQSSEVLGVLEDVNDRAHKVVNHSKYDYYNGILTQPTTCNSSQDNSEFVDIDETFCKSAACTQDRYEMYKNQSEHNNETSKVQKHKETVKTNDHNRLDCQATEIYTVCGFTNKPDAIYLNLKDNSRVDECNNNLTIDSQLTEIYSVHGFTENRNSNIRNIELVTSDTRTNIDKDPNFDNQSTAVYNVCGFTENYSHIGPSQDWIVIPDKYVKGNKIPININGNEINCNKDDVLANDLDKQNVELKSQDSVVIKNVIIDNAIANKTDTSILNEVSHVINVNTMKIFDENSQSMLVTQNLVNDNKTNTNGEISLEPSMNMVKDDHIMLEELTESQAELIPFKVIEELNRIKMYLNKGVERGISNDGSVDSAYKSDSQSRSCRSGELESDTYLFYWLYTNFRSDWCVKMGEYPVTTFHQADRQLVCHSKLRKKLIHTYFIHTYLSRLSPIRVGRNNGTPNASIQTNLFRSFHIHQSFHTRSPVTGTFDLALLQHVAYLVDIRPSKLIFVYFPALQLSGNWTNQSAYCLYEYITRCPLVESTKQITEEISRVLGQLIDKLHTEEAYPQFLEELLEYINELLKGLYFDENGLLKKDENIHRLFLFNKSVHILRYTMEKITNILEKIHSSFTQEEPRELTNIVETENVPYIFHTLEIILKRYLKSKDTSEDNSQKSQDISLRRSDITDIWRRKWNPGYKDRKLVGSQEKTCPVSRCGEVLNKIVVDCMNGYSLVAYSALQCFNLLQL
ncbi:metacaspase-2-like [Galleria mellonella]|uniref:Metacaspase-2-like n=1 Tax=Galleria mellonella TaxID=7137 RepID=A0ABM3MBB8_GALME|nr:metacaspase-2-like [Galleria mellonella]